MTTPLRPSKTIGVMTLVIFILPTITRADSARGLMKAIQSGNSSKVQKLLTKGTSPNIEYEAHWFAGDEPMIGPLHQAVRLDVPVIAELLINKGADAGVRLPDNKTLLHEARSVHVAKLLLEAGADPKARDRGGETTLHSAARHGADAVAEWLLRHGHDVNAQNASGETALAIAVREGSVALTKLLIDGGGTVNARLTELAVVRGGEVLPVVLEASDLSEDEQQRLFRESQICINYNRGSVGGGYARGWVAPAPKPWHTGQATPPFPDVESREVCFAYPAQCKDELGRAVRELSGHGFADWTELICLYFENGAIEVSESGEGWVVRERNRFSFIGPRDQLAALRH